jgi:hypothetical protein
MKAAPVTASERRGIARDILHRLAAKMDER